MSLLDPSETTEIAGSPLKLAVLLLLGIGMTTLGGWMAFAVGGFAQIVGLVALLFFGACTVVIFQRLMAGAGTVVTLSPQGIRDVRLSDVRRVLMREVAIGFTNGVVIGVILGLSAARSARRVQTTIEDTA